MPTMTKIQQERLQELRKPGKRLTKPEKLEREHLERVEEKYGKQPKVSAVA